MYFTVTNLIALLVAVGVHTKPAIHKNVEVTLYYESHCPFSKSFILNQLLPAWKMFGYRISVQLVPYGLTRRDLVDGKWKFSCHHGYDECNINTVAACAVEMLQDTDMNKLIYFIACLEENVFSATALNNTILCAVKAKILLNRLAICVADSADMMLRFAQKTENVAPPIRALPAIQINGVYDQSKQKYIRQDLTGQICQVLNNCPANGTTIQISSTMEPARQSTFISRQLNPRRPQKNVSYPRPSSLES